jgi:hypothetical protein
LGEEVADDFGVGGGVVAGFEGVIAELERRGLRYIMTAALRAPVRTLCCHDEAAWTPTEVPGIEVQDLTRAGIRLVVLLQRIAERITIFRG